MERRKTEPITETHHQNAISCRICVLCNRWACANNVGTSPADAMLQLQGWNFPRRVPIDFARVSVCLPVVASASDPDDDDYGTRVCIHWHGRVKVLSEDDKWVAVVEVVVKRAFGSLMYIYIELPE